MAKSTLGSWLDKFVLRGNPASRTMKKVDLDKLVTTAASSNMRRKQYETFAQMEPSSNMNLDALQKIADSKNSQYSSVRTVLGAYASMAAPRTYLEIGTRRGHSVCMVVNCAPKPIDIYSFDLWLEDYAGEANPGQQFIRDELQKFNFNGTIQFYDGDSKQTVPTFFADTAHPQSIDLIFVDGDHSDEGARTDIMNVIDHVSIGGLLVFDDITHPAHRTLLDVWHSIMDTRSDFETRENTIHEYGWAIALRTS